MSDEPSRISGLPLLNTSDSSISICTSTPDIEDACGGHFPLKTSTGPCAHCRAVHAEPDPLKKAQITAYRQCKSCGLAWKRLQADICGSCEAKLNKSRGQVDEALSETRLQRSQATSARLKKPIPTTPSNQLGAVFVQPSIPLTTDSLNNIRNGGGPAGSKLVQCYVEPHVDGKLHMPLGAVNRTFAETLTVDEFIDAVLASWNDSWTKRHTGKLSRDDVELRMFGTIHPEPNTLHLTLGEFMHCHTRNGLKETYFGRFPAAITKNKAKRGQPILCVELHIDTALYSERMGVDPSNVSTKRKRTSSAAVADKRPRPTLTSTYVPSTAVTTSNSISSVTNVNLIIANAVVTDTGDVDVSWSSTARSKPQAATISDEPFGQGAMKKVFKLTMNGKAYVAKRFWDIGEGPEKVSRQQNADNLVADFTRIKRAAWFLSQFHDKARELGMEIAQDIRFTDIILAKEDSADFQASPASATAVDSEWDEQPPFWLIEPLRSSSISRYNGPLVHSSLKGLLGQTVSAFVHFVYIASGGDIVLVDMQSSKGQMENGQTGEILFDIMTHTKSGLSGVGDHGKTGIKCFVEQHVCQDICKRLGFRELKRRTGKKQAVCTRRTRQTIESEEEDEGENSGGDWEDEDASEVSEEEDQLK